MGLAAEKVEDFIWEVYCDWYIEICKARLDCGDALQADTARKVLVYVLSQSAETAASLHAVRHRGDLSERCRAARRPS